MAKLTPRPVRVVDAVRRVLTTVLTIRIRDAVRVKLVGIQIASELTLTVIKPRAIPIGSVRVVESTLRLGCSGRQVGVDSEVA